jgi:hypothetical protein
VSRRGLAGRGDSHPGQGCRLLRISLDCQGVQLSLLSPHALLEEKLMTCTEILLPKCHLLTTG